MSMYLGKHRDRDNQTRTSEDVVTQDVGFDPHGAPLSTFSDNNDKCSLDHCQKYVDLGNLTVRLFAKANTKEEVRL
ncbi:hypothetical protein M0804_000095 [Polistes exclamans]|nr:hypothetical protein M0804_000095 [Polistes exclamans]